MNEKQNRAYPCHRSPACEPYNQQKYQHPIQGMEKHVYNMVSGWVKSPQPMLQSKCKKRHGHVATEIGFGENFADLKILDPLVFFQVPVVIPAI
jgi:hypothetical protein